MQPTILIVDDEKHTRDGLRRLLEDEYDVYVAADIAGAVNVLFNGKSLGALGKRGQVRTIEFTAAGYKEIVLPTPPVVQPQSAALNPTGE